MAVPGMVLSRMGTSFASDPTTKDLFKRKPWSGKGYWKILSHKRSAGRRYVDDSIPVAQAVDFNNGNIDVEEHPDGHSKSGSVELGEYDMASEAAEWIRKQISIKPVALVVTGSGLGSISDAIDVDSTMDYSSIPHFPLSTVPGHSGQLVVGKYNGVPVVCMKGRVHAYEGYNYSEVVRPLRIMKLLGCEILIATHAAGAINPAFVVGDVLIVKDHVSLPILCGQNPLYGKNDERFGPRFVEMSSAYHPILRRMARESYRKRFHQALREHVFAHVGGPSFETPAEVRLLRAIGADSVGMSLAPEVVASVHVGMLNMSITVISNVCFDDTKDADDFLEEEDVHQEVLSRVTNLAMPRVRVLIGDVLEQIGKSDLISANINLSI